MFGWFKRDEARDLWDTVLTKMMDDGVDPDFSRETGGGIVLLRGYQVWVNAIWYGQEQRYGCEVGPKPSRKVRDRLRYYLELKRHAYKHEQWDVEHKAAGVAR